MALAFVASPCPQLPTAGSTPAARSQRPQGRLHGAALAGALAAVAAAPTRRVRAARTVALAAKVDTVGIVGCSGAVGQEL